MGSKRIFKIKAVSILLLGIASTALCEQSDRFTVKISIDKTSSLDDIGRFYVNSTVINSGKAITNIVAWSQYGWSWVSDNPKISPGINALKNFPESIQLKPGQEYNRKVEMFRLSSISGPIVFRLGFVPRVQLPASETL